MTDGRQGPCTEAFRPSGRLLQQAEHLALCGTIPAFYLAMQAQHRWLSVGLYLLPVGATALALWGCRLSDSRPRHSQGSWLAAALMLGLVLAALLPQGDTPIVAALRLTTAVLAIFRVADTIGPWFWRSQLPRLSCLAIAVLGLCGLGFWWLEPNARTFGDGLWLAFTTAATVGYGDIVPSTPAAKVFAVFVVLLGFAALSLVTAAIAAMWVQREERGIERELLHELHRELRQLRSELKNR